MRGGAGSHKYAAAGDGSKFAEFYEKDLRTRTCARHI